EGRVARRAGQVVCVETGGRSVSAVCGCLFFFFQAGDGIRDWSVTGVQTCALPIYLEGCKRGWNRAEKKVVIGDGAEWIWHIADQHFPGAIQIVDLYHARQ